MALLVQHAATMAIEVGNLIEIVGEALQRIICHRMRFAVKN